jgi:hypothetical protein
VTADPITVIAAELDGPETDRLAWAAGIHDALEAAGWVIVRADQPVSAGPVPDTAPAGR